MSSTRVKTAYEVMGAYGSTETKELYCFHHHGSDTVTFFDENGQVEDMGFHLWSPGNDKWDAMQRLWFPFKDKWHGELLDGVEYTDREPSW